MTSRRAFLSALAAFSCGVAVLPRSVLAETGVPLPVPRPDRPPNPAAAQPTAAGAAPGPVTTYEHGRVIVFRGYLNVFSRGMDKIAADLQARGVPVTLKNHSNWELVAAQLIKDYKADPAKVLPVVVIGHSLGGDASVVFGNWLAHNRIPVRLIVVFDAVSQIDHFVDGGVEEVVNFYKPKGAGQEVKPGPGFAGVINNVDLTERKEIDHLNIDKNPILQAEIIDRIMGIFDGKAKPPRPAPATAAAANG
jgi:hypothetical protein